MRINDDLVWAEKYRPKTVADCILPDRIKNMFLGFITQGKLPNLMLYGSAGTGKTSIARALCDNMDLESFVINASRDGRIDDIRNRITEIATTISFEGKQKCIILDEADGLSAAAQNALKAVIEEYSHTRFIFTCNTPNKIIKPIHSRTQGIDFKILETEKQALMLQIMLRMFDILKGENVAFDKTAVAQIVKKFYPDNRKILNVLQGAAANGKIDESVLATLKNAEIEVLLAAVKEKDLRACRQWITNNADVDMAVMLEELYEIFSKAVVLTEDNPDNILNLIEAVGICNMDSSWAPSSQITMLRLVGKLFSLQYK